MTDDLVSCDLCERPIPAAEYDAGEGLCPACLALHFDCEACRERTLRTDAHAAVSGLCQSCGEEQIEARHAEALDAAADELRELAEAIIEREDLAAVRQAVTALKRLTPKE